MEQEIHDAEPDRALAGKETIHRERQMECGPPEGLWGNIGRPQRRPNKRLPLQRWAQPRVGLHEMPVVEKERVAQRWKKGQDTEQRGQDPSGAPRGRGF